MNMLSYLAYQAGADLMRPWRTAASLARKAANVWPVLMNGLDARFLDAWWESIELAGLSHVRPPFGIDAVDVDGVSTPVVEEVVKRTPFGSLLHFRKETATPHPRVLLVAPMSGHFATLLRGTVLTMLADHDVYITDWHNVRDIPLSAGRFGFTEYVEHLISFIRRIGPDAHLVAICQPTVASLAAVSLMAADDDPAQPASMTLMAGPIDCRVNPTKVNDLANSKPIEWFEKNLCSMVPAGFPGAYRCVYPGFTQLGAFMSMNMPRHLASFEEMRFERAKGDPAKADSINTFYREYFATMDLSADFYLETVSKIFQEYELPLGKLKVGERTVEPHAIRRTALLTVEGEKDDICSVGQTVVAQDLCSGLRPYMKTHHVQTGVGHYGVFSGRRWATQIYPLVRATIYDHEPRARRMISPTAFAQGDQVTLRAMIGTGASAAQGIAQEAA